MNRAILLAVSALSAGVIGSSASAETLNVQGVVAPYCNITLANVSSGTASVAMAGIQTVANLRLACNAVSGTKYQLRTTNGDLVQTSGGVTYRINYDLSVESTSDNAFTIAATDTYPGSNEEGRNLFTRSRNTYSQPVANGIPLVLSLNMNVAADPNNTPTSQNFPANAAPAGTYSEVFTFTATSV